MRIVFRLNLYLIGIVVTFSVSAAVSEVYTLDYFIGKAIKNGKSLRKIKKEIELTELNIQKVYSTAFPQIDASVDLNHAFKQYIPYSFVQNGTTTARNNTEIPLLLKRNKVLQQDEPFGLENMLMLPKNTFSTTIGVRIPLFSQGKVILNVAINRLNQAANICRYEEEKERLRAEVTKLFYRVVLMQRKNDLYKNHIQLMTEQHQIVGVAFANGNGRELDTLNSFLLLQLSVDKKDVSESERLLACEELIRACGMVASPKRVWVEGDFPEPVFFITLDETLMLLNEENRNIRQMKSREQIKNLELRREKMALLPSIFAGGSFGRIGQFNNVDEIGSMEWGDDQRVFAGLSWTLFSGLERKHAINMKKLEREILELEHQEIINDLEISVTVLFEKVMLLKQRIATSERIVSVARKSVDVAKKSYEVGTAALPEVQRAELELINARMQHTTIIFDFHSSVIDFKLLIGKI